MCLATAGLAIGEDGSVEAAESGLYDGGSEGLVDLFVGSARLEDVVE